MSTFYKEQFFITQDNSKINYIDEGPKENSTILFLHDFNRRGNSFKKLALELVKNNRIVWLDFRCHGKTKSTGSNTIKTLASDINELIIKLNLKNITVISYGLGTSVLFQYFRDFKNENIISAMIIDSIPKLLNDNNWHYGLYQGHYSSLQYNNDLNLIKTSPKKFLSYYYSQLMPIHTIDESRDYKPTLLYRFLGSFLLNKDNLCFWPEMINADYRADLSEINIPISIVYGRPGSLFCEHAFLYMNSELPNSKLFSIEDGTHNNIGYKTEELLCIINDLIDSSKVLQVS